MRFCRFAFSTHTPEPGAELLVLWPSTFVVAKRITQVYTASGFANRRQTYAHLERAKLAEPCHLQAKNSRVDSGCKDIPYKTRSLNRQARRVLTNSSATKTPN
ncbi:hypothetical protein RF11_13584 [Thelohanellus kitauei]|uniref:Uncharacterized protein n=1 Tax=Thelohanellus kitauei TaxID=669202 RepID=A0A0C2N9J8_THEKT|nr:hypothetical protein RF11_13584 [Thelohanellus kitauei]